MCLILIFKLKALQNLPYTKPNVMENFEVFRWNIFLSTNSEIGGSVNLWPHGWLSKKITIWTSSVFLQKSAFRYQNIINSFFQKNLLLAVHLDCFLGSLCPFLKKNCSSAALHPSLYEPCYSMFQKISTFWFKKLYVTKFFKTLLHS